MEERKLTAGGQGKQLKSGGVTFKVVFKHLASGASVDFSALTHEFRYLIIFKAGMMG